MSCLFSHCAELKSLPDISKWNTSNVKEMRLLFSGCDISKWNVSNVTDMTHLFLNCMGYF